MSPQIMLNSYFERKIPKFSLGDFVLISKHKKTGLVVGIEYMRSTRLNPKRNGFVYAIATSVQAVPQWYREETISCKWTIKIDVEWLGDNRIPCAIYTEDDIHQWEFSECLAKFFRQELAESYPIINYEKQTKTTAYDENGRPSEQFVNYLAKLVDQGYRTFDEGRNFIIKTNYDNSQDTKATWLHLRSHEECHRD